MSLDFFNYQMEIWTASSLCSYRDKMKERLWKILINCKAPWKKKMSYYCNSDVLCGDRMVAESRLPQKQVRGAGNLVGHCYRNQHQNRRHWAPPLSVYCRVPTKARNHARDQSQIIWGKNTKFHLRGRRAVGAKEGKCLRMLPGGKHFLIVSHRHV